MSLYLLGILNVLKLPVVWIAWAAIVSQGDRWPTSTRASFLLSFSSFSNVYGSCACVCVCVCVCAHVLMCGYTYVKDQGRCHSALFTDTLSQLNQLASSVGFKLAIVLQ